MSKYKDNAKLYCDELQAMSKSVDIMDVTDKKHQEQILIMKRRADWLHKEVKRLRKLHELTKGGVVLAFEKIIH